jgi:hypothetical protein
MEFLTLTSPGYRAAVDDLRQWFCESTIENGSVWTPAPYPQDVSPAALTRAMAAGILTSKQCALPTLREGYAGHQFVFSALQPHFEKLTGVRGRCPVA